jgi:prophage regulatory protein
MCKPFELGLTAVPLTNTPNDIAVKKEVFLRLPAVRERIPYSRATIYRMCAEGRLPRPYSLGAGAVAWLESEIDAWIQARITSGKAAEAR